MLPMYTQSILPPTHSDEKKLCKPATSFKYPNTIQLAPMLSSNICNRCFARVRRMLDFFGPKR